MNLDIAASRVKDSIGVASEMLNSMQLRTEIEDTVVLHWRHEKDKLAQVTAGELAEFLAKAVLRKFPQQPAGGQEIAEMLKPMKDLTALLNSDSINEFVRVRSNPCVQVDPRMPLEDFKEALGRRVFPCPPDAKQETACD